jgi:N-acetylneuraminate synthase
MSDLEEVASALSVLAYGYTCEKMPEQGEDFKPALSSRMGLDALRENVSLLHCTTEYPAPFQEVNLKAMETLVNRFELPVGYSDHTEGIAVAIAAAARGAKIIEKHFTLDRSLPGPDHKASLEPSELKAMVEGIRQVEMSLGSEEKVPSPSELKNRTVARRSLVAGAEIAKGELFTENNLVVKRPGNGVSPFKYWKFLGKEAVRNFEKDELIE